MTKNNQVATKVKPLIGSYRKYCISVDGWSPVVRVSFHFRNNEWTLEVQHLLDQGKPYLAACTAAGKSIVQLILEKKPPRPRPVTTFQSITQEPHVFGILFWLT
jgi:hypothetical protein